MIFGFWCFRTKFEFLDCFLDLLGDVGFWGLGFDSFVGLMILRFARLGCCFVFFNVFLGWWFGEFWA